MTLYEFNSLDNDEEKLAAVLLNGECIAMRDEGVQKITLYQLPAFYVEISNGDKPGETLKFRSFSSLQPLKPYLDQIDLSKLI